MRGEKSSPKGVFIVIDGIDGSGKSTQVLLLAEWLIKSGREVFLTHEPNGKTAFGRGLKALLRSKGAEKIKGEKWAKLFAKQRDQNIVGIKSALESGKVVISDRYYYSTLAYQLGKKEWKGYAKKFLKPDLALILDLPIGEAVKRINKKNQEQMITPAIFEKSVLLRGVRENFREMPKHFKEVKIIDSSLGSQKVFSEIKREVKKFIY